MNASEAIVEDLARQLDLQSKIAGRAGVTCTLWQTCLMRIVKIASIIAACRIKLNSKGIINHVDNISEGVMFI